MITFGPLTSRRLGYSLGVNHIPMKNCSYDCIYCQVGPTHPLTIKRQAFYSTETIVKEIEQSLEAVQKQGKRIDAITFVPDGEPGLDIHLGDHLRALKPLGIKLAVISNGSLLIDPAVREDFSLADWVSVKVDSVDPQIWRNINRPYGRLNLDTILESIRLFAQYYSGELVTETMLAAGVNHQPQGLGDNAKFIAGLHPTCAYLSLPLRPPLESWVTSPNVQEITTAYQIYQQEINHVELLGLVDPQPFVGKSGIQAAILATAAVHPLNEQTIQGMLNEVDAKWEEIEDLLTSGKLKKVVFNEENFYITQPQKN